MALLAWTGGVLAATLIASADASRAETPAMRPFPSGQAHYYEGCGGCHGLQGVSARKEIPVLKDRVGRYLCTQEGRDYLVRLPNVAFAGMDNAALAETMNYVVFTLGAASVPPNARPYTASEVGRLRQRPLKNRDLATIRTALLAQAQATCGEATGN